MTPGAIAIRDLSKSYRLYPRPADMLVEALTGRKRHTEFRALEGVSFEIEPGTVLGIMGRNGAGKSTLLRIIAGTLPSTGGTVFELGGLCIGMARAEIRERFDEIVAFSELEEFIDRPFGTYSTGMQARLTFALATCVDPDILIVDEALSVGDAKFQLKSFDRIRDFKSRGKSILLVTHSINQVVSICDRAILLERGRIRADGDPNRIGHVYHELLFGGQAAGAQGGRGEVIEVDDGLHFDSVEQLVPSTATTATTARLVAAGRAAATANEVLQDSAELNAAADPASAARPGEGTHNNALFAGLAATPRDTPDVNPVREREPGSTEAARAHSQSSASREPDSRLAPNSGSDLPALLPDTAEADRPRESHISAENSKGELFLTKPPVLAAASAPVLPGMAVPASGREELRAPEPFGGTGGDGNAADAAEPARSGSHRYGNGWATILDVQLEDERGERPILVKSGHTYRFVVEFVARKPLPSVCIGFLIRTSWGIDLIGTDTRFLPCPGLPDRMRPPEQCRAVIEIPLSLAPGTYFFTISVVGTDETKYDLWFDCLSFTVAPTPFQLYTTSLLGVPINSTARLVRQSVKHARAQKD
ncbi:MAG: ABC-type polysaccharide/polyol phosphate transport system, ATPase component [Microvirga sp.]|nr:ABC-type polysaccharide/polyol phosphate transport system, ATPase component [Microvirga sp.]